MAEDRGGKRGEGEGREGRGGGRGGVWGMSAVFIIQYRGMQTCRTPFVCLLNPL